MLIGRVPQKLAHRHTIDALIDTSGSEGACDVGVIPNVGCSYVSQNAFVLLLLLYTPCFAASIFVRHVCAVLVRIFDSYCFYVRPVCALSLYGMCNIHSSTDSCSWISAAIPMTGLIRNLLLRGEAPCPLGHTGDVLISVLVFRCFVCVLELNTYIYKFVLVFFTSKYIYRYIYTHN